MAVFKANDMPQTIAIKKGYRYYFSIPQFCPFECTLALSYKGIYTLGFGLMWPLAELTG